MLPKKEGQPEPYALEDMISDIQARRNSLDHEDLEDPAELLKKRDRDLVLAAELGKALLERNQELTKQSESLVEEYSSKLESLEQERHLLRRRLEEVKGESEARALELQADVETLRSQLEEQNERARRAERDQATLVTELTAQNTRFADQLREAAKQEEQLLIEVKVLREKCAIRSTTLQDHVSSLEVLRDEVQLVSAQRTELERRSLELREERARAMAALEEAEERAAALERLGHEAEHRAKLAERERAHASPRKVDLAQGDLAEPGNGTGFESRGIQLVRSSLSVIVQAVCSSSSKNNRFPNSSRPKTGTVAQTPVVRLPNNGLDELAVTLAAIEAERRGRSASVQKPPRSLQAEMECEESGSSLGEQEDLRSEVARAAKRLKELCVHLRRGEDDSGLQSDCDESMLVINTTEEVTTNGQETLSSAPNCPGALLDIVEEVYNLALSGRGAPGELGLAVELHRVREELEHTKDQLKQTQDELKRRGETLLDMTSKLSVSEAELRGVKEERDRARGDMEHSQLTKDEVVAQAYKVRDQAVARKNRAEVELAKTRIDVLQANSQLMEAIQQKIELSQQLEQWQMDVQLLLDEHVRSKMMPVRNTITASNAENTEIVAPARKKRSTGSTKKMFGFF
ncbi:Bicaudal D-related protein like protein [Dufourea novaeangliae]|uniref:Bicaudal D-related protein like protein n=1 Tax=Dufourea novaeangliae TaxID=178035 RepID=A0A154PL38_DUFNO|nr:Bicaudal D-related protein like protein [Dufourea novaeangliae]